MSAAIPSSESVLPDGPEVQAASAPAGQTPAEQVATGSIHGVVMDKDGSVYEGAKVELVWSGAQAASARTVTSDSNGQFQFSNVPTGSFQLNISSGGFGTRTVIGVLRPGESFDAKAVVLDVTSTTDVRVTASQVEIAQEQLKQEETQRVLGVIPNFYVVYDRNPAPLTPKQKFHLAWRSLVDPVTFLGVGAQAGIEQATNSFSGYGQGAKGYAKRYGAGYTDGFTGTMIGGAILASWWKQDPRYFYKGTGTIRSRALYAIAMTVMCKGDNGKWQVTYSGLVGGLERGWADICEFWNRDRGRGDPEPNPGVCDSQADAACSELWSVEAVERILRGNREQSEGESRMLFPYEHPQAHDFPALRCGRSERVRGSHRRRAFLYWQRIWVSSR